ELMGTAGAAGGPDATTALAELLNQSDRGVVDRVLETLQAEEPEAAEQIRRRMFTFEDLARIDRATFGVLISECPVEKLAIALGAAPPAVRDLFLSSMSERAA